MAGAWNWSCGTIPSPYSHLFISFHISFASSWGEIADKNNKHLISDIFSNQSFLFSFSSIGVSKVEN